MVNGKSLAVRDGLMDFVTECRKWLTCKLSILVRHTRRIRTSWDTRVARRWIWGLRQITKSHSLSLPFYPSSHIHSSCVFFFYLACRQLEFGIQGMFGPADPILGAHIQSICEALDIPHIETRIGEFSF